MSPTNIQGWFPLGLTGLISLHSEGLSRVFSSTTVQKNQFLGIQPCLCPTLTSLHDSWKKHSFDYTDLCRQSDVSAFLHTYLGLSLAFLPRSKHLLILWLQPPPMLILEPPKIKSVSAFTFSPSTCHEVMGADVRILVFWMLSFKPTFSLSYPHEVAL